MDSLHFAAPVDARTLQNQPTSTADSPSDEVMGDADEPPDERKQPEFKKISCAMQRKQSLLTRTFHSSESDTHQESHEDEDIFSNSTRAHSSASTWSRGSVTSNAELTSDGHTSPIRASTPSPPPPSLRPAFNKKLFDAPPSVRIQPEAIDPLKKPVSSTTNEDMVEAFMKRKRCIMFSCGKKAEEQEKKEPVKQELVKPTEAPKRACTLKFGPCPTRDAPAKSNVRLASPPPPTRKMPMAISPKIQTRSHRGSDSTVRNDSPKSVRKIPSTLRARRASMGSDFGHSEATRFHEFASSEEEVDEWTQEATCHRKRLTVEDTLEVENKLRKIGKEAEDEAMEEDEELDEDEGEDGDDDDDDDDNDSIGIVDSTGYVSDEGFASDDEHGFAGSDDESDAGSDYQWWAPGASASGEQLEHIRPRSRRSNSNSSMESFNSTRVFPSRTPKMVKHKKSEAREIRPRTPDLPDSTDFVCGTLDEDRPLEQAYISCLEQRRAAKHRLLPQDIDPTFPASDPDMEEEDEDSDEDAIHVEDSDHHMFIHGHPDVHSEFEERQPRGVVPKKRSPPHSPRRMRSPPPAKRTGHRSPPPRRLFGHSPKRMRSPPPNRHIHSPPPTRRTSFAIGYHPELEATPVGLAQRPHPHLDFREASSVPRNGPFRLQRPSMHDDDDNDDDADNTATERLPTRGAIDIVKGLEKKRQRRREKLFEKHARQRNKGKEKQKHFVLPGRGAERMREMGLELAQLRGKRPAGVTGEGGGCILSY
jgi:hypothetical protein